MPLQAYANQTWYGPASLTIQDGGAGAVVGNIQGDATVSAPLSGEGSVADADITRLVNSPMTVLGEGSVADSSMIADARFGLTVSIGSRPSADDVAQAVWGSLTAALNEPGTMGERIQKALTVAKFIALK